MATQGPLYPGTAISAAVHAPEDDDAWVTPTNVGADDGNEATITAASFDTPDISRQLYASQFGFTIPAGSTIDGILVEIQRRASTAPSSASDHRVQLTTAENAFVGDNKALTTTDWPLAATTQSYGGAADTWNASPTVAMVNAVGFGVTLSAQADEANADIQVDFIRVTITYTPPADNRIEVSWAELEVPTNRVYDQAGFRGRNDDGSETTATWKAAENTDWSQAVDENFRFRAVVDETALGDANAVLDFKLQYNLNGAGWNDVNTTSSVVRTTLSPNVANGAATTRQLAAGTGTFVAGSFDENNGAASSANTIETGELTELEWCAQVRSADVVNNDTIDLRVVETTGSIVFAAYTQVPTITVVEATPDNRIEVSWIELEVPNAPARIEVSWAELEVPAPQNRIEVSFAELETPDVGTPSNRIEVSWVELEIPNAPNRIEVSWAEFEVDLAPNRIEVSWAEMEFPDEPDNRIEMSWAEMELPEPPGDNRIEVSWAEFEFPTEPGGAPSDFEWVMDWITEELVCKNRTHDHYPHYPKRSNEDDRIFEPSRPGEL